MFPCWGRRNQISRGYVKTMERQLPKTIQDVISLRWMRSASFKMMRKGQAESDVVHAVNLLTCRSHNYRGEVWGCKCWPLWHFSPPENLSARWEDAGVAIDDGPAWFWNILGKVEVEYPSIDFSGAQAAQKNSRIYQWLNLPSAAKRKLLLARREIPGERCGMVWFNANRTTMRNFHLIPLGYEWVFLIIQSLSHSTDEDSSLTSMIWWKLSRESSTLWNRTWDGIIGVVECHWIS